MRKSWEVMAGRGDHQLERITQDVLAWREVEGQHRLLLSQQESFQRRIKELGGQAVDRSLEKHGHVKNLPRIAKELGGYVEADELVQAVLALEALKRLEEI